MNVCIAWMFVEGIYGSTLVCYVHSIDDFFISLEGVRISILRLVRLHRFCFQFGEAGAITSILFSSWAGADHEILCCTFLSPLSSRRRPHIVAGPSVRWALLRAGSFCNAPRSHPRRPPAAELRLAVIIIMIERGGGPHYCFD